MPNIIDILARAQSLMNETALNSITPPRAGGIMYDTLLVLNQVQLEGASLLISKVYASVSAMEADTTPTSDLTGRVLKPGQLVVIVTSDVSSSDMGSEYRYNGPGSWTYVGKVGGLPLDTEPTQGSTKGITSGAVFQVAAEVNEKVRVVTLVGQGNTGIYNELSGLEGGHSYRVWIDYWKTDQLTSSWSNLSFYVRYDNNGSYDYLYTVSVPVTMPKYVDITLPDGVTKIEIGGRVNSGDNALVRLDDITPLLQGQVIKRKIESPVSGKAINTSNSTITGLSTVSGIYCHFIPVREGEQYLIRGEGKNSSTTRLFALFTYDSVGNNFVRGLTFGSSGDYRSSPRYVVIPAGVTHLAVNFNNYNSETDGAWLINGKGDRLLPFWEFEVGGMGSYKSTINLNNLVVKGHTYRLMPKGVWETSSVSSPNTILGVYIDLATRVSDKITVAGQALSKFYDFTIPADLDLSAHSVDVSARANFGFRASFFLQDITASGKELFPLSGADGTMATFMDAVQRKSDNIGLTSSTWNNPYGGRLYGFNRTTVRDLLKATIYAAGNPRLMDIMGATETEVRVWGEHARVVTITNDIPTQLATYYQTLHGSVMPYKILANKAGAHANESDLSDNGFSLLVVAIVSGHYVAAVVGIGNTSQGYTSGRNNRVKGMIELLDIVKAHYDGADISGMSVVSCEKAIAAELPSDVFPQCYRKDAITPIYSQDADTIFMPASTSKVMAAITMVDFLEMGDFYRITDNADELVNDSDYTAYAGDVQSVETSFYAMLIASNGANTLSLARIAGEKILNQTTSLV